MAKASKPSSMNSKHLQYLVKIVRSKQGLTQTKWQHDNVCFISRTNSIFVERNSFCLITTAQQQLVEKTQHLWFSYTRQTATSQEPASRYLHGSLRVHEQRCTWEWSWDMCWPSFHCFTQGNGAANASVAKGELILFYPVNSPWLNIIDTFVVSRTSEWKNVNASAWCKTDNATSAWKYKNFGQCKSKDPKTSRLTSERGSELIVYHSKHQSIFQSIPISNSLSFQPSWPEELLWWR